MKHRIIVLLLPLIFMLVACSSGPNNYSDEVRRNFLEACEVNGTASYCACALEATEARLSEAELTRVDIAVALGQNVDERTMDALIEAAMECQ